MAPDVAIESDDEEADYEKLNNDSSKPPQNQVEDEENLGPEMGPAVGPTIPEGSSFYFPLPSVFDLSYVCRRLRGLSGGRADCKASS